MSIVDEREGRSDERITDLMRLAGTGSTDAKQRLYARVYDDLRSAARRLVRRRTPQDLQTTEIVNEVVLRFEARGGIGDLRNRHVLFSVAIRAMRQVLVDQYRRRKKLVDSPDRKAVPLDDLVDTVEQQLGYDVERLESALAALEAESPRQYAVITHRFFGGMTISETARVLDVSQPTVERDWKLARAKLFRWMRNHM